MLSAEDYDAEIAERYGWINRALPAAKIDAFVRALAHRIANLPVAGRVVVKSRVNEIALPSVEEIRRDGGLFREGLAAPEARSRLREAMKNGMQTREGEVSLPRILGELGR